MKKQNGGKPAKKAGAKRKQSGTGYSAAETNLWRATTPQQKAYWADKVRSQSGQGIHFFENNPVGKLIGPALQGMVSYSQYLPYALKAVGRLTRKAITGRGRNKKNI